ncbi:MAG: LysE family translocator [Fimbriimonadaceae bacterium]|nr:LysE family translocator [Alphaproteobacteria bacterium]
MFFSLEIYLAFVLASFLVAIVPGPSVTVIIANSLAHGTRAGLLNVAGTQLGVALVLLVLLAGLTTIVETMAVWFEWVKLAGAAYLVWLGIKLWRSDGSLGDVTAAKTPRKGFFWQGFIVVLGNPKLLFFFGAFIPQFIDPKGEFLIQVAILGVTFMVVAGIFDSVYAILAGRAGSMLARSRVRLLERISGSFLIGGGIWLALARRAE